MLLNLSNYVIGAIIISYSSSRLGIWGLESWSKLPKVIYIVYKGLTGNQIQHNQESRLLTIVPYCLQKMSINSISFNSHISPVRQLLSFSHSKDRHVSSETLHHWTSSHSQQAIETGSLKSLIFCYSCSKTFWRSRCRSGLQYAMRKFQGASQSLRYLLQI